MASVRGCWLQDGERSKGGEGGKVAEIILERIHLEIFEALAGTGSLTRAGEVLNLTQSALTHSVRKLESMVGTKLWEKDGRNLRLTRAGDYLLSAARRLLPYLRETEDALRAYGSGKRGRLRIGVECHPCYEYLVGIIDGFLREWKSVDIDVTRQFQFDGVTALKNHEVDLIVSPDMQADEELKHQEILDFELKLLVPCGHHLETKRYVRPEDLSREVLYTYPIGKDRLDVFTQFLIPSGARPKEHVHVEATEIMMQLVAAGRGVSTFPDWLIAKYATDFSVTGVRLGKGGIQKKLYVVARQQDLEVPYLKDFMVRAAVG